MVIISTRIIAPPGRERLSRPTGTKDGKGQYEQHRKTGTVKSASDQVRAILKEFWAVVSEVELSVKAGENLAKENTGLGCVVRDVSCVLNELRHVDIVK